MSDFLDPLAIELAKRSVATYDDCLYVIQQVGRELAPKVIDEAAANNVNARRMADVLSVIMRQSGVNQ